MDITGAVDLSLGVSEIDMPGEELLSSTDLERLADKYGYGIPPVLWARLQLTRLAAASVLEARLFHVRASRLEVFGLVQNPETVTLQQLAPLQLVHKGTAGQAFEIAVADAVNAGHLEVTGLIRAGLRRLNLRAEGPLSMVVLGMEKVPQGQRDQFYANVRSVLPENGKFRTGMRGRPGSAEAAIDALALMNTKELHRPSPEHSGSYRDQSQFRDQRSQLGRADALVVCGPDLVAASLKIDHKASKSETWRDVPLWITVGPEAAVEDWREKWPEKVGPRQSPRVSVVLPNQGWFAVFRDALDAVDVALERIKRDRPYSSAAPTASDWDVSVTGVRVGQEVARTLWQLRRETIAVVAAELRQVHPGLREAAGEFAVGRDHVHLTSLDVAVLLDEWRKDSDDGLLFTTQEHLFRPLQVQEKVLLVVP